MTRPSLLVERRVQRVPRVGSLLHLNNKRCVVEVRMLLLRRRSLDGSRRVASLLLLVSEFLLSCLMMLKAEKKATSHTLTLIHMISVSVNASISAVSLFVDTGTLCAGFALLYSQYNALLFSRRLFRSIRYSTVY
jgi:uncharacterized membrane protein